MPNLDKEFQFYLEHKAELAEKYSGKYVVIKEDTVLGVYNDIMVAVRETAKTEKLGSFLVQLCSSNDDNIMCSFHSRVSFAR